MSGRSAMLAVDAVLTDVTHGLNARLALYRTANSLTTAVLPDYAQFDTLVFLPRGAAFPYATTTLSTTGPETRRNSRLNDSRIDVAFMVLAKNAGQSVAGAVLATQYTVEVFLDMLDAVAPGREGATLFDAAGVHQAVLVGVEYGVSPIDGRDHAAATVTIDVQTQRPFPTENY